jgi:predicted nucleic acid-binding protein
LIQYLDTSVLVAAMTAEARSSEMQRWLGQQDPQNLAISAWVTTEFSAALSIKLRASQISAQHRAQALADFADLCRESLTLLPINADHFAIAAWIANQHALGLRAADALHLAIAFDHGAAITTLDQRLAEAGPEAGVRTHLL